jgi:hypothetical protein
VQCALAHRSSGGELTPDLTGQVQKISGSDIKAQATFIAGLFQIAA